ncbi:PP2C family serine/threonine-protein phosphatase [Mycoplasma bradburyae]|uniref:Serine/threonine-protein phosphatase n=1 Tax=Mycoplasma bradburyae TaxID=2963128 RepID=A0AAW6HSK7_9MOLU|nr:PP2C family serine/threonine-protein phosphatase [Mycoplasma bradburyae]MDC4163585.1 serine/threonine-protein phosphatase [Mycoplasma bradburyae]MDC4182182.1 serine/threonine-protein phosphatase [Mycoplasma bradburyae]MDC4182952.1 serine/threonine-protein phosphatase [Mycoplasma bradburyae]MDC4183688.1 serine/threonine-protein phosphatase [Mycoplasma bradburyae]MDC4184369.1 serine/threonine-protein phosphatase [Mycoplasma bradburyae]
MKKIYASSTHVGTVREENQDAVFVGTNQYHNIIALVCDGLGGYKGGAIASSITRDLIRDIFLSTNFNNLSDEKMESWFKNVLLKCKQQIYNYIVANDEKFKKEHENASLKQMATTIVLSIIANNKIYTFWVGDSRAYLIGKDKKVSQITNDHNLYNYLKKINASAVTFKANEKELLALTNIVSKDTAKLDFDTSFDVIHNDDEYLLLSSDGFYNFVMPEKFHDLLSITDDMQKVADNLLENGMSAMSNDNLSVVVVKLTEVING